MKNNYQRINNGVGFLLMGIATLVYWKTMEPTLSFWDCGEFIAASYKLQVGHQPGAPLFLMIGKLFSLLAVGNTAKIAYWVNASSVLFSAATIMFLYWTITALASRLYAKERSALQNWSIIAAGTIGALAYAFSDTFWFSAVEAEVYALSSLFTAIVFWAILKWERELNDRWLIFIAFTIGLSIGAHLLSLLTIPAVVLVYYFRKTVKVTFTGTLKAFFTGCLLVGIVQFFIVQYLVLFAAKSDLFFVNTLGFSFGSGALAFIILLAIMLVIAIRYSLQHQRYNLNLGLLCLTFLLFGFSTYFAIIIRADAKPAINLSNPDNAYSLYEYLGRTNYGETPLFYGKTFDAQQTDLKETGLEYRKGAKTYEVSGKSYKADYDKNLFFPRTHSSKPGHPDFYRQWMGLAEGQSPTFIDNLNFFASYQVNFMYFRYLFWNFVGRQNDIQNQGGSNTSGNWITGIRKLDALRLGNQEKLPQSITANEGHNVFYGLPLLLGIVGICYLFRKNKQLVLIAGCLFFFTGLAIILFLNQDPLQPRERDYAYGGSFYVFAIFISFGVLAIQNFLSRYIPAKISFIGTVVTTLLAVPTLMGIQGWDDHDRSQKTTAIDWAKNYLNSCAPNAILFTNADNDTYPLWYAQEVEGIRTDVRVVSIQFLSDPDYINQLKKQLHQSAPLPITMTEDKYVKGIRDYLPYVDYGIKDSVELKALLGVLLSDNPEDKVEMVGGSTDNFLPTKQLKLTINPEQVLKTNTVAVKDKDRIVTEMEWTFNKNFALRSDLALFDILVHNNWERPVYFGTSLSDDTYIGMDKYLYLEGYAYRLLPLKRSTQDQRDKSEMTNSDVMYNNVMKKLDYTGFNKASYLDPESRRIAQATWVFNNTLTGNLIAEGKTAQAKQVIYKSIQELPLKNYDVQDTLSKLATVQLLYQLNDEQQANLLTGQMMSFLDQELAYIASLDPENQRRNLRSIQQGLYVLNGLDELTATAGQKQLNKVIKEKFSRFKNGFIATIG